MVPRFQGRLSDWASEFFLYVAAVVVFDDWWILLWAESGLVAELLAGLAESAERSPALYDHHHLPVLVGQYVRNGLESLFMQTLKA